MFENNFLSATSLMFNGGGGSSQWDGHMMSTPFGGLFMILILVGFVGIMFMVLKGSTRNTRREDNPMDILKRRYASGEIDKEQYDRMKQELTEK